MKYQVFENHYEHGSPKPKVRVVRTWETKGKANKHAEKLNQDQGDVPVEAGIRIYYVHSENRNLLK